MPKVVRKRNLFDGSSQSNFRVMPKNEIVNDHVHDFFDNTDGYTQEFDEFMFGWNTKPVTGYEDNFIGFFGDHFMPVTEKSIEDLKTGLGVV